MLVLPAAMQRCVAAALLLLPAVLNAQAPPGGPMPLSVDQLDAAPGEDDGAAVRFKFGQEARKKGDLKTARQHLRSALEFHPASPVILQELVLACADDPDQRAHFTERLLRACTDKDGRCKLDAAVRRVLPKEEVALWEKLCQTRAAAAAEVARLGSKLKDGKGSLGNGVLARWCAELGHELMADAPQLYRAFGPGLQKDVERFTPEREVVLAALQKLMARAPKTVAGKAPDPAADPDWLRHQDQAIRAARILAGLGQQSAFRDLQGPAAPDLVSLRGAAQEARERLQLEAAARAGRVWSIEELVALDPAQRGEFTLVHRNWSNPGIALSQSALYRIETVCGFETLLGAAQTIELHHRRLADHFGADPFSGRQGNVHIVPEHGDLESEGAPYWWAGGFQSGDRTTIRFAWGRIPAMGRLLTHELTHRFDGVVFPFQPAWLTEGHAVWTAASYGRMADGHFADRHLDIGACLSTRNMGYGRADKLEQLVESNIEDYRDNYAAGCALYTFLRTWPIDGQPKYRDRLGEYRKNGRAGIGKGLEFFTRLFCDGKDGRAASFGELAGQFDGFLDGIARWSDRRGNVDPSIRWVTLYQFDLGNTDSGDMVPDEPTYSWARDRAEPFFGQDHAAAAGVLLAEVGETEAAAAAFLWALWVDGWQARMALPLPALLQSLGKTDAAAVATALLRLRFPTAVPPVPVPMASTFGRTQAVMGQLAKTATALPGRAVAARLLADHNRLAALLGLPPLPRTDAASFEGEADALPRWFGVHGLTEDSLTGYDTRRHKGLWFVTPELDVHVGREQPRSATGTKDRTAHIRSAFVRASDWQAPGAYTIRARIYFTTSYATAAIVFGHVRRDRDLRLQLSAGDYDYAVGRSEQDQGNRKVGLHLEGLWERDQYLPRNTDAGHELANDSSGIGIEIQVRGPSVLVLVEGVAAIRYATHDGTPIEGSIGFATSAGAIRVQQPTVQRLDRGCALAAPVAVAAVGLDLLAPTDARVADLLLRPVTGVPPGNCGTLLLWIPKAEEPDVMLLRLHKLKPYIGSMLADPVQYPATWRLCVPEAMGDEVVEKVQAVLATGAGSRLPVLRHRCPEVFTGDPWVLFVDEPGLLRAAAQMNDVALYSQVGRWARLFRRR